jgi:hypothetical protein
MNTYGKFFENGQLISTSITYGASQSLTFSNSTVEQVDLHVQVKTVAQVNIGSATKSIIKRPPNPSQPNGGLVLICSSNELPIEVATQPLFKAQPNDYPNNYDACFFHCGYIWDVSSPLTILMRPDTAETYFTSLGYDHPGVGHRIFITTLSPINNGNLGTITVKARYPDCAAQLPITQSTATLWGGTPTILNATVNGTSANSMNYNVQSPAHLVVSSGSATSYSWYTAGGSGTLNSQGSECYVSFSSFVRVIAESANRCGTGHSHTFYLFAPGYQMYRIAPNPADKSVQVSFTDSEIPKFLLKEVSLYNKNGKLISEFDIEKATISGFFNQNKTIELNTSELPKGTYFVKVTVGDKSETHQILKE